MTAPKRKPAPKKSRRSRTANDAAKDAVAAMIDKGKAAALVESLPALMVTHNRLGAALAGKLTEWANEQRPEDMSDKKAQTMATILTMVTDRVIEGNENLSKFGSGDALGQDAMGRPLHGQVLPPLQNLNKTIEVFRGMGERKQ